jgi:hypothetical protein
MYATANAHGEHKMIHDKRARLCIFTLDLHCPLLRFRVL